MFFVARQLKLILQAEKRETSTQNLKRNDVARQVEGFGILYLYFHRQPLGPWR